MDVELHWAGGLVESHILSRPVKRYDLHADYPRAGREAAGLVLRGVERRGDRRAAQREGFRPPKRAERFNRGMVQRLLWHLDLAGREPHGSLAGRAATRPPGSLARRLEIWRDTVRRWLRPAG